MKTKAILITSLAAFLALCGVMAVGTGVFSSVSKAAEATAEQGPKISQETSEGTPPEKTGTSIRPSEYDFAEFTATQAKVEIRSLGALYPEIERTDDPDLYKFEIDFTSLGAGVRRVTLSEFANRDVEDRQPLVLLSSANTSPTPLANGYFGLAGAASRFPLHRLNWAISEDVTDEKGVQRLTFQAVLKDAGGNDAVRLTKTFRVIPGQYDLLCELVTENLSSEALDAVLELQGPGGISREDLRSDVRKVMAAFLVGEHIESVSKDYAKLRKARQRGETADLQLRHKNAAAQFMWAAVTNKYFAAILRPVPRQGLAPEGIALGLAQYTDPDLAARSPGAQASAGFGLQITDLQLAPAGQEGSSVSHNFDVYLGPKDRDVFESNPLYRQLAYFQTIDFRGCCCPSSVIAPLAFGIITIMKWMYKAMGPFGNYGVVIMILVFVVRLILHPITKKSQVSMMKMQKMAPRMEELKRKYAGNKTELNKQMMLLYREQGASPVMGFLPMLLQMPIWIALWTAIYTSIELRGAPFLPFWITDLSAPDALIRFRELTIPLLGWTIDSFNLLPILMGGVMYAQQKLMPTSATQTNPQVAQQQKMMMILMPLMFPIMLYQGPSGVNLYILSSISAGVLEQMVIRKHIREKEEEESHGRVPVTRKTGGKVKKKKPKPFFKT
ncbi:MAG: YidC/Oxa1 family insertase periplasmic-domain containing protein [Phycisphaerae bacterium]|nr:YidC/Oxa1 family insertase periplasmic-domain containing protein [Phycisphaerae bacterium]